MELRFSGVASERWTIYREYVLASLTVIEPDIRFSPTLFACESALISGEDPERIPWPDRIEAMRMKWEADNPGEKFPEPQWVTDFKQNDETVAASCLASSGRRGEIMHPLIANMPLCRHKLSPKWRNATYIGSNTGFPAARHVQRLTELWIKAALVGARNLADAPENDRKVYSWALHDAFLSIQPFKDGNERTARSMFQLVRRELDLPKVFFSRDAMVFHSRRVKAFRSGIFIPLMKRYHYLN